MQMKHKLSQGAVRPKKLKNLVFYRNVQMFLSLVKTLKEQKANFKVSHSKYTTSIILPDGSKMNFILQKYRDKVFISNKNDIKRPESPSQISGAEKFGLFHKELCYSKMGLTIAVTRKS
jgi:hypothetical protein